MLCRRRVLVGLTGLALMGAGCGNGLGACTEAACQFSLVVRIFGEGGSLMPSNVEVVLVLDGETLRCPPVNPTFGSSQCLRDDGTGGVRMHQFDSDGELALQVSTTLTPNAFSVSVLREGQEVANYHEAPVQYLSLIHISEPTRPY